MSDSTPNGDPTPDPIPDPIPEPTPDPAPAPVPPPISPEPTPEPTPDHTGAPTPDHTGAPTGGASKPSQAFNSSEAVATLKKANPLDLGIIGLGLLTFIASLMPYYTVTVRYLGTKNSGSENAWTGFFGWFAVLCALAAAALLVVKLLDIALPIPARTAVLGLFGAAALLTILALFVIPGGQCDGGGFLNDANGGFSCDKGHGFGYWLALLATIGGTALAAMRLKSD